MTPWESEEQVGLRAEPLGGELAELGGFMNRVYMTMAVGLTVTGGVAMGVATSESAMQAIANNMWLMAIALIGMVFAFSAVANRVSSTVATGMFLAYAALNGAFLSLIFAVYTRESIAGTFFITGGTFAAMSAYGYFTKRDLTKLGSFLMMGLIGLVIASIVNIFLQSSAVYWVTTYAGVLIFVGLTAWDTQKIKHMYFSADSDEARKKLAVHGALALYLDFVNLFLYLLRLFGRRR